MTYPHVRSLTWCPMCGHGKAPPNLFCAPCTRGVKQNWGTDYPDTLKLQLEKIEHGEHK